MWPDKIPFEKKQLAYAKPGRFIRHCYATPPPCALPPRHGSVTDDPKLVFELKEQLAELFEAVRVMHSALIELQTARGRALRGRMGPLGVMVFPGHLPCSIGTNHRLVEAIADTKEVISQIKSYGGTVEVPRDLTIFFRSG